MSRNLGVNKFVSIGNEGDLTSAEYLEYLGDDDDTNVIVIYLEGFKNGRYFLDVARKVARKKTDTPDERRQNKLGFENSCVTHWSHGRIQSSHQFHSQAGRNY